jgi:acyl-CoA thioesterase I
MVTLNNIIKRSLRVLTIITIIAFISNGKIEAYEISFFKYVAIGDSYSIGEGVHQKNSWPAKLTQKLSEAGVPIKLIANPSKTGWTVPMAIQTELPILKKSQPNFVTLLIGVNDWIRHANGERFQQDLKNLIDEILKTLPSPKNLLVVTIPDFSCSPTGFKFGFGKSAINGISRFNKIVKDLGQKRNLSVVDIFSLSQQLCKDPGMFAPDGLHPSGKQYEKWISKIFPSALAILK